MYDQQTIEHRPRAMPQPRLDDSISRRRARDAVRIGILLVVGTVITALAAFSNPPADAWLWRRLQSAGALDGFPQIDAAWVAVASVTLVAVALVVGWRCRVLRVAVPASAVLALGVSNGLAFVVDRDPPPLVDFVGQSATYPSTSVIMITVAGGMLLLALEAAGARPVVRRVLAGTLGLAVALLAVSEVIAGGHWPLDVLGGLTIGLTLVLGTRLGLDRLDWHRRCTRCWRRTAAESGVPVRAEPIILDPDRARVVDRIALAWSGALLVGFGLLASFRGIPRSPQSAPMGDGLELPLTWATLLLIVVGVLVARRWHMLGAVIAAIGAVVLGYASSVQYAPWIAVVVSAVAFVPALLLWVEWHRRMSLRAVISIAVVTSLLLGGVVAAAASTYSLYWGPTHPVSLTAAPNTDVVEWLWAGATTSTSVNVRARTAEEAEAVALVVSARADLADPIRSAPAAAIDATNQRVVSLTVDGLVPDRTYFYALEVGGELVRDRTGTFRTFPEGPASFTFAASGDSLTGSNGQVYDAIRQLDPLFFVNPGDFFYGNITQPDPGRFFAQYAQNLRSPAQAALYASTSFAYTWGDHDFAGNDSDGTAPAGPVAYDVYRELVPHYPLAADAGKTIAQAFTVGRVRVIMTDNRIARDPAATQPRSMLGADQLQWLLAELGRADQYGAVIWVNADPWIATPEPISDTWAGFAEERATIADAIAADRVTNLLMVSGDAHMLAFDDGTNSDYSATGDAAFPVLQTAALDRQESIKGGPYSGPVIPGGGQFATVAITDDGTTMTATITGWNWKGDQLFTKHVGLS